MKTLYLPPAILVTIALLVAWIFPNIKDWGSYFAAILTIVYVCLTHHLLRAQNNMIQKQEDSQKDSMRPFLTIKSLEKPLLRGQNGNVTWGLYLINIGAGPAIISQFSLSDGDSLLTDYYDSLDIKTIGVSSDSPNTQLMFRNTSYRIDTRTIKASIEYSDIFGRLFKTHISDGKVSFEGPLN